MRAIFLFVALLLITTTLKAQHTHYTSQQYQLPDDALVRNKLEEWQDKKFGIIIHWGIYAVPGIIESWSICNEEWIDRDSNIAYEDYKKWYFGQSQYFNPVNFNPEAWAAAARSAGMKYLVFTTKHHDGFAMFDTRFSDFGITKGPFKNNPKADVAKYIFDAFRKQQFMIGAYFSKPDWHTPYYWWPKYATADRNVNYDIRKFPWRWNQYKQYTFNQIDELMTGYGNIDILWLDGGWVRPLSTVNDEVRSWGARIPEFSQEIDMDAIAANARKKQPGILMVDRTVHGPYENYLTPEQRIPDKQLPYPWESCMTLGYNWGYVKTDKFKTAAKVIHSVVEIVAKGGSLLLGIGPQPDGALPDTVVQRLHEIGTEINKISKAIYNTRITNHYNEGNTWFTRSKDNKKIYAIYCVPEGEQLPATISWSINLPAPKSKMILLETGENVKWQRSGNIINLKVPSKIIANNNAPALAFEFEVN